MNKIVISTEHLGKRYELGIIGATSLQRDLNRWWARKRGKQDPYLKIGQEFLKKQTGEFIWALDDVNLEVKQGEALGIIGHNGAGKSTLLKILSQVTAPTTGKVKVKGRIGSLLEVGTGFHPELTGRENVFLNGAILGMTRAEVERKFDEIVDFSGVEKYIDTPVKRYSSGMYVRLGFAVAAHLDPEILIVDEVLAVGDAEFQKRCLGKMDDVAHEGRTVVFVSHNLVSIRKLCNKAILLVGGKLISSGEPNKLIRQYLISQGIEEEKYLRETKKSFPVNLSLSMQIDAVRLLDKNGDVISGGWEISTSQEIFVEIEYTIRKPINSAYILCSVKDEQEQKVLFTYDGDTKQFANRRKGHYQAKFRIQENLFNRGRYKFEFVIYDLNDQVVHRPGVAFMISINDNDSLLSKRNIDWPAMVRYNPHWETHKLS